MRDIFSYPIGERCFRVVHRWKKKEHFAAVSRFRWADINEIGRSVFFVWKEAKQKVLDDLFVESLKGERDG